MKKSRTPVTLRVAQKDLKILLRDRGTMTYLFALPLLFMLAFGGAFGVGSTPKEEAIPLPIVNLDAGSEESGTLLEALNQNGGIEYELYEEGDGKTALERGSIKRLLTIPADYGADLRAGQVVTLHLVNAADASATKSEAVHRVVSGVAADLSLQSQLISSFRQMADMQGGAAPEQGAFTTEIIIEQAQSQFERSRTEPLLGLEEVWSQHRLEQDEGEPNPGTLYVPGFIVLFLFLSAGTTAQSIYGEKKLGSFRRLLAAPVGKLAILGGKMVPNLITGLIQTVVLLSAGAYLLPLMGVEGMELGNDPLALVLVCAILLLCATSLGALIAGLARTEAQVSAVSQVVLWICGFAAIWLDKITLSSPLDVISQLIPHTWAHGAFMELFVRGAGVADIVPSLTVLLGFTIAFFAVGLWRFDYR
jgi:ABC-2 type transport system permease protein